MSARVAGLLALGLALCAGPALAQLYKWKDDKGVVHYSDTPPPEKNKQVELKDFHATTPTVALPYALAQAVKNAPVTLYTTADCVPCDQARNALRERGVPFTEKTVSSAADRARLTEAGGSNTLPFVLVGSKKMAGYDSTALQALLTSARYPLTRMLPSGYQSPAAQSAAPATVATPTAPPPADAPPAQPLPPSPTGIRF